LEQVMNFARAQFAKGVAWPKVRNLFYVQELRMMPWTHLWHRSQLDQPVGLASAHWLFEQLLMLVEGRQQKMLVFHHLFQRKESYGESLVEAP
jgi:hypothetical protein